MGTKGENLEDALVYHHSNSLLGTSLGSQVMEANFIGFPILPDSLDSDSPTVEKDIYGE